jgi:SOS-response transcriptional repressor LexA
MRVEIISDNPVNERFKEVCNLLVKQDLVRNFSKLAEIVGVHPQNFTDIKSGKKRASNELIMKVVKSFPAINFSYITDGVPPKLLQENFKIIDEKSIPYYPDVNASAGLDFLAENGHNYNIPIKIPNVDAQAYINVFGDSMYPKYCSGEIIGVKEIQPDMVFFGHAYVIQMIDGEAYIKYIDPGKDDEHWTLRSENERYKPKQFHLSKINKVFVIKAVITKSTIL